MTLSRKTVIVIVCTFIALACIVAATSDVIMLRSFRQLEVSSVLTHVRQIRSLIKDREDQIDLTARDFSAGLGDMLADGISLAEIGRRYFGESNMRLHRVDLVAMFDEAGALSLLRAIECGSGSYCDVPDDRRQALVSLVRTLPGSGVRSFQGTVSLAGEPLMLSIRPVRDSAGIRYGYVIAGCFLDKVELEHYYRVSGKRVYISGLEPERMTPALAAAHAELSAGQNFVARVEHSDRISGYFYQRDIYGAPSFMVSISDQRFIYEQGRLIIFYIVSVMFACSIAFCAVILIFFRSAVLQRLARLTTTVGNISLHGDISERLEVRGSDELENLAGSINSMLASLDAAEQAVKESEKRYRTLFERAPDSVFILETDSSDPGRIVDANMAACVQHGYSREELCAMRIQDLNTPETNLISPELFKRILGGEWVSGEVWHYRKDGSRFPIEVHAGLVMLEGRTYILGFDRDISARKLAEENDRIHMEQISRLNDELESKAAELSAANRELESFNYSVSHDLRGPLTRISGYCQLLMDDDSGDCSQTRTYLARIYESCCRLDGMIDAMLSLSRFARTDFDPVETDLSGVVREVLQELSQAEPGRAAEFVIQPGMLVRGDERMLRILVSNLAGNSWKYSADTGCTRIEFGRIEGTRVPVYFIRDNGVGFDMKQSDKLFRVFTRLHDATRFSGTGIGLATAQRVVTRHGGRIWAEGEPGQGATFYFTLSPSPDSVRTAGDAGRSATVTPA